MIDVVEKIDEILDEARFRKVIRKGKVKRKLFCPKGFKAVDNKCVKMSPEETRKRKRATRRAAKKRKGGVLAKLLKKRKKSLRRREQQIHTDPDKAFAAKGLNERMGMWLYEAKEEKELLKRYDKLGADIIGLHHGGGGIRSMLKLMDARAKLAKEIRDAGIKLETKRTIKTKAGNVPLRK